MKTIYKTFFNQYETEDEEEIKNAYRAWAIGASMFRKDIPEEDFKKYYYEHYIISGISFEEFKKIVRRVKNANGRS